MIKTAIKFCAYASAKQGPHTHFRALYTTISALPSALHLQATDGHRVHSIKCYIEHDLPIGALMQVQTENLMNMVKMAGRAAITRASLNPTPDKRENRLTFHLSTGETVTMECHPNSFDPLKECEVRRPHRADPIEVIGYDSGYLADAHKAFSLLKPVHNAVRFEFHGTMAGTLLTPHFLPTVPALHEACVVIMPCRVDG